MKWKLIDLQELKNTNRYDRRQKENTKTNKQRNNDRRNELR